MLLRCKFFFPDSEQSAAEEMSEFAVQDCFRKRFLTEQRRNGAKHGGYSGIQVVRRLNG